MTYYMIRLAIWISDPGKLMSSTVSISQFSPQNVRKIYTMKESIQPYYDKLGKTPRAVKTDICLTLSDIIISGIYCFVFFFYFKMKMPLESMENCTLNQPL